MSAPYWTIRPATLDDVEPIMRLVRIVHGDRYPEINQRYWTWRYHNNDGFAGTVFIAEHDGQVIGLRPTAIFNYQWGSQDLKGAMYTGVMTHPDHRRRGVFRSLVECANGYAADAGAAFCMTLPNESSLPGFQNTTDWRYPGSIPVYVKPIDTRRLLASKLGPALASLAKPGIELFFRHKSRTRLSNNIVAKTVETMPEEFDAVAQSFAQASQTLTLKRTAALWNWRYAQHPHTTYHMQWLQDDAQGMGAVVTGMGEQSGIPVGLLIDIAANKDEALLRSLIHAAERRVQARDAALITCQATTPLLQRALLAEGFRRLPLRLSPKRFHFVYRLTGKPGLKSEPRELSDWHLMFGDSDNA